MKRRSLFLAGILCLLVFLVTSQAAAFVSGSTCPSGVGCLGDYTPANPSTPTNVVITLPKSGILNYGTVNIPSNLTVTFKNYSANTPVYILAAGDVTIAGTINVSGTDATPNDSGKGGPGGFNGGYAGGINLPGGQGLGPGGGAGSVPNIGSGGGGGGFSQTGGTYGTAPGGTFYGNDLLLPLIGGSGGGGAGYNGSDGNGGGGGGGGALLIASSTGISHTGAIKANGGIGYAPGYYSKSGGGGSGGAVKLVANTITGNGTISAQGGISWKGGLGSPGRIRLESFTNSRTATTDPPCFVGSPGNVFISNPPSITITSIGGVAAPAQPTGNYYQPDIPLPSTTTNPVAVNVSASNIPDGTTVTVWVIPQIGSASSVSANLSGGTAIANVNLSTIYSNVVTAQASFTVVGLYYDGEEIDKARVAATLGGKSETTYITKSGKEIKGELVAAFMK
jgi:hypothetical protein